MKTIKFLPEFIPAIEDGRKRMTRRLATVTATASDGQPGGKRWPVFEVCPYGQPGDRLRVEGTDILLEIVSVRVERVQEITEDDAWAEGITRIPDHAGPDGKSLGWNKASYTDGDVGGHFNFETAREAFQSLFDSIYPGAWDRNDWVWVVESRKLDGAS